MVAEWLVAGKSKSDIKHLMQLPISFHVDDVSICDEHVEIHVSSPDIPACAHAIELQATYKQTGTLHGQWDDPESYRLTNLIALVPIVEEQGDVIIIC